MTKTSLVFILPAMDASARLVISGVIVANKEFVLSTQAVVIGRENSNDLVLKDPEMSRRHARITYQAGRYYVEDLGSTNGTFLNDQQIRVQMPLNHGDVIRLGESIRLTYYGFTADNVDQTYILHEDPQDYIETPPVGPPPGYQPPPYQGPQYQRPQYQQPPASPRPVYNDPVYGQPPSPPDPYRQNQAYAPAAAEPPRERSNTRILLGCGCLLVLAVFACGASLYLLDSFAPDLLYCGFLQPVVEGLGITSLACP